MGTLGLPVSVVMYGSIFRTTKVPWPGPRFGQSPGSEQLDRISDGVPWFPSLLPDLTI